MIKLNSKIFFIFAIIIILGVFIVITRNQEIKIGFVAQLTGMQAELGTQERNGVQLAVEEINNEGGIAGRKVELIIKDDLGTELGAKEAVNELIEDDVVAIIGHATSSQTNYGLEIANQYKKVMISPTASTYKLSGIDDYLLRVVTSNKERSEKFAIHLLENRNVDKLVAILDMDNAEYVNSYWEAFGSKYKQYGEVKKVITFSSKEKPDFSAIASTADVEKAAGVFIIANDYDTAMIAQSLRNISNDTPIFSSSWAQTQTLINHGGQAVEGMEIEVVYPQDGESKRYIDFNKIYKEKFGADASFGAAFGYESMGVLKLALEKTRGKESGLKEMMLETKDFEGLIDTFSMDEYGDVQRPFYFSRIKEGRFSTVDN